MTTDDKMRLVLELAGEAMNEGELPIAAIIFHNDTIVVKSKTSEVKDKKHLIHAELKALLAVDNEHYSIKQKKEFQLFTNLEPCMMCLGATIASFIGEVYYTFDAPSDGAARWASETWNSYQKTSAFILPKIFKNILVNESKKQFEEYVVKHKTGGCVDWVKTLL